MNNNTATLEDPIFLAPELSSLKSFREFLTIDSLTFRLFDSSPSLEQKNFTWYQRIKHLPPIDDHKCHKSLQQLLLDEIVHKPMTEALTYFLPPRTTTRIFKRNINFLLKHYNCYIFGGFLSQDEPVSVKPPLSYLVCNFYVQFFYNFGSNSISISKKFNLSNKRDIQNLSIVAFRVALILVKYLEIKLKSN